MATGSVKALLNDHTPDLKKLHSVIPQIMKHAKRQKTFIKLMTKTWSTDEDSRRILAFLNILKGIQCKPDCIGLCIKTLFSAYVRNCKFVHGSTMAHINFMRMSLLELFGNNLDESYVHAFYYIRQLAIGLQKAYASQPKDAKESVQNWLFIESLRLWTDFVAKYSDSHKLIPSLAHPLIQMLIGVMKLTPGERWLPLCFHCVNMLHVLAGVPTIPPPTNETETNTVALIGGALSPSHRIFVPTLPFLLETFKLVNFNRRATVVSKAPMDLRLLLHFSPSQSRETASLDAICSCLCDLLTEAAAIQSSSVAFPEFVLPLINELKTYAQTCRVAAFTRQMKALQVKLREHSDWITVRRRRLRNLTDADQVVQLESILTNLDGGDGEVSPFLTYYVLHKKVRAKELARLTESNRKEAIPGDSMTTTEHGRFPHDVDQPASDEEADAYRDEEDEDSDADSDESYDLDDGTSIVHVSKSKNKNRDTTKRGLTEQQQDSDSESDFDLEAALKETEIDLDDVDGVSDGGAIPDDLAEFELSDSEEDDDLPMVATKSKNSGKKSPLEHVYNTKRKSKSAPKKRKPLGKKNGGGVSVKKRKHTTDSSSASKKQKIKV